MTNASGTASLDHVDYDNGLGQTYQKVDVGRDQRVHGCCTKCSYIELI